MLLPWPCFTGRTTSTLLPPLASANRRTPSCWQGWLASSGQQQVGTRDWQAPPGFLSSQLARSFSSSIMPCRLPSASVLSLQPTELTCHLGRLFFAARLAGITWCLMAVQLLIKGAIPHVLRFTAVGAVGAVVCLCWSVVADYGFYGKWVIIQYEFLRFNLLQVRGSTVAPLSTVRFTACGLSPLPCVHRTLACQGSASFYGTHAGHWYLTQGFPVVMGTSLPLLLYGAVLARELPSDVAILARACTSQRAGLCDHG